MIKLTEKHLKDDFVLFVHYIWDLLGLPAPTKVQILIAQFMADPKHQRKIIEAFRGVGKSYLAYSFVVWKLWNNPNLKFLIVSASKTRADNFSITCQSFIDMCPFLRHLRPTDRNVVYSKVKWYVNGASTSGSPSVMSVGIESNFTGSRADIIIPDDVESEKNSWTVDQREKLIRLVGEFEAIKKGDEGKGNNSEILFLGTPQNEESLYNYLHESGLYKVRIWPGRYPMVNKVGAYKGKLCPILEDELYTDEGLQWTPTDPKRFTEQDLTERELMYGKAGFYLQFMLDTELSDAERYPLRTSNIIVYPVPNTKAPAQMSHAKTKECTLQNLPRLGFSADRWFKPIFVDSEYLPFEGSILAVDPSGTGGDETGYAVIKSLMGYLYVTRAGGLTGGYDDNVLMQLSTIAKEEQVGKVIIEKNFGDGMFLHLWKPVLNAIYPCTMEEVRNTTQKERRIIDTLEPVMARHKLVVDPSVIELDYKTSIETTDSKGKSKLPYSLFYQMTRLTKDRGSLVHDDRLDALAIGVGYFTERMSRNPEKEVKALKEKAHNDWLAKKRAGMKAIKDGTRSHGSMREQSGDSVLNQRPMRR